MKRNLHILGLATVLGGVALVAAQQSVAPVAGNKAPSPPAVGATASKSSDGMSANSVTQLLISTLIARKDTEVQRVLLKGREERVPLLTQANCASILTVLSPEERKRQIDSWQIGTYAPNDPGWAAVTRAPQIAKKLLKVSDPVSGKVSGFIAEAWADRAAYYAAFRKRVEASPEYKAAKTNGQRNVIWNRMNAETFAELPLIDRAKAQERRFLRAVKKARPLLTPDQRAEFDIILERSDALLKKAAGGNAP